MVGTYLVPVLMLKKFVSKNFFFDQGIRQLQQQCKELHQRDQDFGYQTSEEPGVKVQYNQYIGR